MICDVRLGFVHTTILAAILFIEMGGWKREEEEHRDVINLSLQYVHF